MNWNQALPRYESLERIICTRTHGQLSTEPENCMWVTTHVRRDGVALLARVYLRRISPRIQHSIDRCVALHTVDWHRTGNWDFELADYAAAYFPELSVFLSSGFDHDLFALTRSN
jgi:hypothetical protein